MGAPEQHSVLPACLGTQRSSMPGMGHAIIECMLCAFRPLRMLNCWSQGVCTVHPLLAGVQHCAHKQGCACGIIHQHEQEGPAGQHSTAQHTGNPRINKKVRGLGAASSTPGSYCRAGP